MRAGWQAGDCPRGGDHHLRGERPSVEAGLKQQELMACATSSPTPLNDDTMALFFERGYVFDRQDQRFDVEK
jgi:hypothetical protein